MARQCPLEIHRETARTQEPDEPFLLWWRPFWQSLLIVSWGWGWATLSYLVTDSAASHWCFFVSFYAVFVLVYALLVKDDPHSRCDR